MIALIAPLIPELPLKLRFPTVIIEIVLGVIVGPYVLKLITLQEGLIFFQTFGLTFLFFLAGLEINFNQIQGRPINLAIRGWFLSFIIAILVASFLHLIGFIRSTPFVAIALCTTAMGVLIPILKDTGRLETQFGKFVVGAGLTGEFFPIISISLLSSTNHEQAVPAILLLIFTLITISIGLVAIYYRPPRFLEILSTHINSSSQLPVRLCLLIMMILIHFAYQFKLDLVLGAFAAGMIVNLATRNEVGKLVRYKLEAIGFSFFIPIFFVSTGINFDLGSLLESTNTLLRIPVFLFLFLLVRGIPVFIYRHQLSKPELIELALFSSTGLPLVVAITHIGVETGQMLTDNATALVGAAMCSMIIFPLLALSMSQKK
ncbi:MAG: cation:proton antiporter [Gomphosphaeria aponina SAG 52.96 = DSM 107014]|uniref:Cation:proton antiporter n=1 Tax=Gomphosphaeria aponina SAG 52.96 = DSM 107014 TaxID=1521640 RepID=A0A941JSF9_9CHRO|nr:cation:proton antiporter [Gomphosphaeria aponina SAG 52.96 = DSM 107014]